MAENPRITEAVARHAINLLTAWVDSIREDGWVENQRYYKEMTAAKRRVEAAQNELNRCYMTFTHVEADGLAQINICCLPKDHGEQPHMPYSANAVKLPPTRLPLPSPKDYHDLVMEHRSEGTWPCLVVTHTGENCWLTIDHDGIHLDREALEALTPDKGR